MNIRRTTGSRRSSPARSCRRRSRWLADLGMIGKRADGLPMVSGIPVSILWWIALTVFCTWLLTRTRFGNWIFASGGDPNAARNVGVPVGAHQDHAVRRSPPRGGALRGDPGAGRRLGRHAARQSQGIRGDHRGGDRRHAADRRLRLGHRRACSARSSSASCRWASSTPASTPTGSSCSWARCW